MRCFKVCLIVAEDSGEGSDEAGAERAVWVVEVKQVQAIMSTITIIVINIAL